MFLVALSAKKGAHALSRTRQSLATTSTHHAIFNSTLGFEKVFVISRPDRTDRRDAITIAASITGIEFDFVDGVDGNKVPDKAIPTTTEHSRLKPAVIGCWRSHMNIMQDIVKKNISTALVLEDDADWDVALKFQLFNFSLSVKSLLRKQTVDLMLQKNGLKQDLLDLSPMTGLEIPFDHASPADFNHIPPYGDGWDLLWIGHSEMGFVPEEDRKIPKWRVSRSDSTVPQKKYLQSIIGPYKDLRKDYPDHTRVTHHAFNGVGTTAYAVSHMGARRVLYHVGLKDVSLPVDNTLRAFCDGPERCPHTCIASQPSLFEQYRPPGPAGLWSDIHNYGNEFVEKGFSWNLRHSIQHNMESILEGKQSLVDQWPDTD